MSAWLTTAARSAYCHQVAVVCRGHVVQILKFQNFEKVAALGPGC